MTLSRVKSNFTIVNLSEEEKDQLFKIAETHPFRGCMSENPLVPYKAAALPGGPGPLPGTQKSFRSLADALQDSSDALISALSINLSLKESAVSHCPHCL